MATKLIDPINIMVDSGVENWLEGYLFNQLKQEPGEGLDLFMSRIQAEANLCDFGTIYDQMVKDCFLCGLRDPKIQSYLLSLTGMDTAAKVLTSAKEKENAQSESVNTDKSGESAHLVSKTNSSGSPQKSKFVEKQNTKSNGNGENIDDEERKTSAGHLEHILNVNAVPKSDEDLLDYIRAHPNLSYFNNSSKLDSVCVSRPAACLANISHNESLVTAVPVKVSGKECYLW